MQINEFSTNITKTRPLIIPDRERETIIAALHFSQRKGWDVGEAGPEWDIAVKNRCSGDGALTKDEIDELVERRVNSVSETYVVSFGDPFSGLRPAGPFDDYDDAFDPGESARAADEEFLVVEVQSPEGTG